MSTITSGPIHDAVETGVFQVQRCSIGEKNFGDGPWQTETRCATHEEALAYIKAHPVSWTSARVFCEPRDVELAMLAAGVVPAPPLRPAGITSGAGIIMGMHANGEIDDAERNRLMKSHFEGFVAWSNEREKKP